MKKLMALLLTLCLLCAAALAEMGEDGDVTVTLEGAEFFFTPMEGSIVLTRESSASVFNRLGMSQRDVLPYMEEYGVYAMLYDDALMTEVQIGATATVETDFDEMNDFGETLMCESFRSYYADMGYDVASVDIYHAEDGHKFVRSVMSYTYEDGYVEAQIEYLTCQAGYSVSIVVFPYEGMPTEDHMAIGDALADSLWIMAAAAQ